MLDDRWKTDSQYGFQLNSSVRSMCRAGHDKILSAIDSSLATSLYTPNLRPFFSRTLKGEKKLLKLFTESNYGSLLSLFYFCITALKNCFHFFHAF